MKSSILTSPSTHAPGGVGDNTPLLETEMSTHGDTERENQLGTGESKPDTVTDISDDSEMNSRECLERWKVVARLRLKDSVVREYSNRIKRFNRIVGLDGYTRREFKKNLHDILVNFFSETPKGSWRYENSKLADYFRDGLLIEWPEAEVRRIQGRLPSVNQGYEPDITEVIKWIDALIADPEVYRKVIIATVIGFGLRPEHMYKLLLADLRYDEKGEPCAIVANGQERSFKKPADIADYLPPWYRECLKAYLAIRGSTKPSEPLFCYADENGQLHSNRPLNSKCLDRVWSAFIRDHNRLRKESEKLSRLLRVDFRHWVCGVQENMGLSLSSSAYMVGHSQKRIQPTYRGYYAHKRIEVALQEQEQMIPEGLIMRFATVTTTVETTESWFNEWMALGRRFFDKKDLSDLGLATEAGRVRLRHAEGIRTSAPQNPVLSTPDKRL